MLRIVWEVIAFKLETAPTALPRTRSVSVGLADKWMFPSPPLHWDGAAIPVGCGRQRTLADFIFHRLQAVEACFEWLVAIR